MNTNRISAFDVKPLTALLDAMPFTFTALLTSLLVTLLMLSPTALARVPLIAEGNENLSSALYISDPGKSWAIYGFLESNQTEYYSFDLQKGERIYLSLIKSANPSDKSFRPVMALIGPGIKNDGALPGHIMPNRILLPALPEDVGVMTIAGKSTANATYEPFGPSSFVELAELNLSAPEDGRYYAAVYSNGTPGHYGLAVGYREEFGFMERIGSPLRLISVYLWSGQSPGMILIPYLAAEIVGLLVFWRSSRRTAYSFAGTLAAFLFLATSASILNQTVFNLTRAPFGPEVYVSLAIAAFHGLLGVAAVRLARGEAGILQRVLMGVIGTIALLSGSGLIMGPLLAIAASVLPSMNGPVMRMPRLSGS